MEAVKLMRGKVGTDIKLTIRRKNTKKALEFILIREILFPFLLSMRHHSQ